MNLARGLERRLENLADGASASLFRGEMHPIDIATRLVRQVDFLAIETAVGPEVPNDLVLRLNPADINDSLDRGELSRELANVVTETAAERGWRLVGPVSIQIVTSHAVPRGILEAEGVTSTASTQPWGQLIADDGSAILVISLNRTLLGRSLDSDIRIANQEVSRRHVIIYRQEGSTMIHDLGSSNGTFVNGARLTNTAVRLNAGDSVMLGDLSFTYRPLF
ncbi:MAG: DUF3662 and FHA domain-containing protein [Actinomycetota bacterium]|nr:DUF3662 and FHA domain-containing protein [Actinomycetota bacterium]